MRKKFPIATLLNILITVTPLALLCSVGLWILFALLGIYLFDLAPVAAVGGGLTAVFLHWLSDLMHQLGHGIAARRVGYPMREIRLLHVLAVSLYPKDEPELLAEIHIQRALGGAPVSFLLALLGAIAAWLLRGSGVLYLLSLFFFWENFLVIGLGAFLPLGFTDGSTLLEWWPKRSQR